MATTYSEAEKDVVDALDGVIDEFFPEIRRCSPGLVISVLMAENEDGDALKKYGAGVVAMVKKSTGEDKAEGGPDIRILIDAGKWNNFADRRRRAVLAHELRHVEIQWEAGGKVPKLDDYGRPRIRLVPDDWVLTGFGDVARWFGEDAVEVRAVRSVHDSLRQLGLPFAADDAGDQAIVMRRVAEIEAGESDVAGGTASSGPMVSSVSFSGKDFDVIGEVAKKLRRKDRSAIVAADAVA